MLKQFACLACAPALTIFLAFPGTAAAQEGQSTPRFEAGLTYSLLHVNSADGQSSRNGNGGDGYIES